MKLNLNEQRLLEAFDKVDISSEKYFKDFMAVCEAIFKRDYDNRYHVLSRTAKLKRHLQEEVLKAKDPKEGQRLSDEYWEVLLMEARNRQLDSALLYIEKKREPQEKFYAPKRKQFLHLGVVQGLQSLLDDELDLLSISLPPGTGKTTMIKFFNALVIGWWPEDYNLFFSHSSDITRMYYDGILQIVTDDQEYAWHEMFPELKVNRTNAKMQQFNVGKYKAFPSVQCTTAGSENAGKVRCNRYLLVDDLIGTIEEALSRARLDTLWNVYSVDARQRKVPGCKEIHIATRWSVHDVISRLQVTYGHDSRYKFIAAPDCDPETGKSNFDYEYNGFDEKFFRDQALTMDEVSYRCLYKNDPIEREGLLYPDDSLRRFSELPQREPDSITGVCDTKEKGGDYMFMPIMYQYDDDFYLVDCVCDDNSDFGIQYNKITDTILRHDVQQMEFEANQGGMRIAYEIRERLINAGSRCNVTEKFTETNKETKIIVNADWIKRHVLFRVREGYASRSDYGIMMDFLTSHTVVGKNKHDDVPDGLANFALFVSGKLRRKPARIMKSPL